MAARPRTARFRNTVSSLVLAAACLWVSPVASLAGSPEPPVRTSIEGVLTVRADRTAEELTTVRIKVLKESALEGVGQQNRGYIEGMQTLDIVEAYTEKADGQRLDVDPDSIITRDGASGQNAVYTRDAKVRTIIFPDVAVGDTLVLTTRLTHKQNFFAGQFVDLTTFARSTPLGASTMKIVAPKTLGLKVEITGDEIAHLTSEDGDTVTYQAIYSPKPRRDVEPGQTSPLDHDPHILVSTFSSYEELGRSFFSAASPKMAVTPEIQKLADEITRGLADKRAEAEAIDRWMKRNIRYVGVYLANGRVVPHAAATVLKNRYGDCKDHTALMAALLAARGIASEQVLINHGDVYTLPETVAWNYFNHVMLYLPELGIYDDPTASLASFGVLPRASYDKPVLHASATGAHLARTPAMRAEDHTTINRTRIAVAADGTMTGETVQIMTGANATDGRNTAREIRKHASDFAAAKLLEGSGNPGRGQIDVGAPQDLAGTYTVKAKFVLNAKMNVSAGTQAIPQGLAIQKRPGEFLLGPRVAGRHMPFMCFAGRQVEEIDVSFADGLTMPEALKGRTMENRAFTYQTSYQIEGRTLKIRREFVTRVAGQVCAPELEKDIAQPLKIVADNLANTKMLFPKPAPAGPVAANKAPQGPVASNNASQGPAAIGKEPGAERRVEAQGQPKAVVTE